MFKVLKTKIIFISISTLACLFLGVFTTPAQASVMPSPIIFDRNKETQSILPNPSPGPSPTPQKEVQVPSSNISTTISAIKDSALYSTVINSPSYQAAKTIQEGLANTGLIAAAAQSGRVLYNMAKVAVILWLVSQ